MSEITTLSGTAATASVDSANFPIGDVLREIAKGGISGALVGIVVGGLGARIVMRVVALLHPDAVGALTENGNRIGDITLGGTVFLLVFGLIFGVIAGALWVIISPWIPGPSGVRPVLAAGVAIAVGTPLVIIGRNPDFVILDHDPAVVALLVVLVGLVGLSIALLDSWLDRRLPHAVASRTRPTAFYATVTLLGTVLVLPFVLLVFLTSDEYQLQLRAGFGLLVVGLCTGAWWGLRIRGRSHVPRPLLVSARGALLVAVVLGALTTLPHLSRALGARY